VTHYIAINYLGDAMVFDSIEGLMEVRLSPRRDEFAYFVAEELVLDDLRLNALASRIFAELNEVGVEMTLKALKGAFKGFSQEERDATLEALQALGLLSVSTEEPQGRGRPSTFVRRIR
jgi:hypothetical protein